MDRISEILSTDEFEISKEGSNLCSIISKELTINIGIDDRDDSVESDLIFHSDAEYQVQTHVVLRLFRNLRSRASRQDLSSRVEMEIEKIGDLLIATRENHLAPRDLRYFQRGYNAAYTDYASGEWELR
jgi:hypothetical protein